MLKKQSLKNFKKTLHLFYIKEKAQKFCLGQEPTMFPNLNISRTNNPTDVISIFLILSTTDITFEKTPGSITLRHYSKRLR
jgi:hypothetical protein